MNLLGKATDPAFWSDTVRNNDCYRGYLEERHEDWNKYCENQPITEAKYKDFKQFFVTGDRSAFESVYFFRRAQLATSAVMALIYPEEEKYIDFLNDIIFAICNEYTWSVSAHHPKLEAYDKTFIDLFAAETGFALAEIYTIFGDRLDTLIRERIRVEINERIIDSFMSERYFWWEKRCTNNWTAVCGGSVGATFMLMRPELFPTVKPRLDKLMEAFLSGFCSDGYCLEGTSYWHYGFGYFITYADMLKIFTGGNEDYFRLEKVKNIATFLQKMFLTEKCAVSFADGESTLRYHIGILHYLKKLYPSDVKVYSPKLSYYRDACFRFALLLRSATWLDEDIYNNPEPDGNDAEYYAEESKWYVKRNESYGFAAKAGFNNEHHNHNDVGTFIFAKCGKQLITDMGKGVYSKQYFRKETRYSSFIECSSMGHSVPYFDGIEQKFGDEYSASDVKYSKDCLSMDIAGAYGDERIRSVKRVFLAKNDSVTVRDSFDVSDGIGITERLVSLYQPKILDGSVKIESCEIFFDKSVCDVACTKTEKSDGKSVYLIDFKIRAGERAFEITIK
ncbi:MAG: heparinase II/III family protein [Clostridia bacterium]|nr:heparinase II/III family protein [Clostridia bacterium]